MRTGKSLTIYLPPELSERLEASAKRNYRTKTVQVILALEGFLSEDEAAGSAPAPAQVQPGIKKLRARPRKGK
jgi:predicted DNA-binding protein